MKQVMKCLILIQILTASLVANAETKVRSFLVCEKPDTCKILELQINQSENEHSRVCAERAELGAQRAFAFLGAEESGKNSKKFPVGRVVIDVRGYDGICATDFKNTKDGSLTSVFVDKTGVSHSTKDACIRANKQDQNVYLRVTPIAYNFQDRKLPNNSKLRSQPGYRKELVLSKKSVSQLQLAPPNGSARINDQQYARCEAWTNNLLKGLAQKTDSSGAPLFDRAGNAELAQVPNIFRRFNISISNQDRTLAVTQNRNQRPVAQQEPDEDQEEAGE